jgi:hypothetical protein
VHIAEGLLVGTVDPRGVAAVFIGDFVVLVSRRCLVAWVVRAFHVAPVRDASTQLNEVLSCILHVETVSISLEKKGPVE